MADSVSELIAALRSKQEVMAEMLSVLDLEQESIVALDLATLDSHSERKRQLLIQLETVTNRCRQLMRAVAAEQGVPGVDSLSQLIVRLLPPDREAVQGLQSRLLEGAAAMNRVLAFNRELLQASLRTVNRSLDFFNRGFSDSCTYGDAGRMVQGGQGVRLFCKEI